MTHHETNLTVAGMKAEYENCNLLLPVSNEVQLNPFYKYTIMEVKADVSENSGDIFKVGNAKVGSEIKKNSKGEEYEKAIYADVYSPAKPLLMKLATAAGIQFDPYYTTGAFVTKNCYKAKAYGAIRLPDGSGKTHADEKVISLDDEQDRFRLEFMDKSLEGIMDERAAQESAKLFKGSWEDKVNKYGKVVKAYIINESDRQKYIERSVMVNMMLLRKTIAEKAMTGAILRVIRALIGMKGTYTKDELAKPFIIPRVTFSPDYSDPQVRNAMIAQGLDSVTNMFGARGQNVQSTQAEAPIFGESNFNAEEFFDNPAFQSDQTESFADDFVAPLKEDPPEKAEDDDPPGFENMCKNCGEEVSDNVKEFSVKKYKRCLCMKCQKSVEGGKA